MGPARTKHHQGHKSNSTTQTPRKHSPHPKHSADSDALPGVQKIKSALRQTRRLLAKDTIAADVRIETERRLKSLENDLAQAETTRKERAFALKYHKVKFFERQKVLRKINQTKRSIEAAGEKGKEKKKLEKGLSSLRVDLNYILHFPKMKKYISLFPPETRNSTSDDPPPPTNDENELERSEIRSQMKARMESGELSAEPEVDLRNDDSTNKASKLQRSAAKDRRVEHVQNTPSATRKAVEEVAEDDFFENASDDGSGDESEEDQPSSSEDS